MRLPQANCAAGIAYRQRRNWPNNAASLARLSDEQSRNFAMQVLLYRLPVGDCALRGRPIRLLR